MYKHIYNHASSSQNWSKHHHHYHHQIPLPAPPDYHQEIRSGTRVLRRSKRPEHNLNVAPVVADIIHYDVPFAEKDGVVGKAFPKKLCRDIIDAMQRMHTVVSCSTARRLPLMEGLKNLYAPKPFADRSHKFDVTLTRAAPAAAGRPIDLVANYVTLNLAPVVADIIHYDVTFAEKDGVVCKAFPKKLCRDIIDAMQCHTVVSCSTARRLPLMDSKICMRPSNLLTAILKSTLLCPELLLRLLVATNTFTITQVAVRNCHLAISNWSKHHHHYHHHRHHHHKTPLPAPPDYHQEIRSGRRVLRRSNPNALL